MTRRIRHNSGHSAGFSLVEILVVMVIMGLVVSAIMSLYVNMQRNTGSSEEVVEVQQGLRIGLDRLTRDLRMAGFLVTGDSISNAAADTITLLSATSNNTFARINTNLNLAAGATTATFAVSPANMAQMFDVGDKLRIVEPASGCLVLASTCLDATSPVPTVTAVSAGSISVSFPALAAAVTVGKESMLVRAMVDSSGAYPYPNTITYVLVEDPDKPGAQLLLRRLNGAGAPPSPPYDAAELTEIRNGAQAGKLAASPEGLSFVYMMEDGSAIDTTVPTARLGEIESVRVVLRGETIDTQLASGVKTREAGTIVKLRNR